MKNANRLYLTEIKQARENKNESQKKYNNKFNGE